MMWSLKKSLVVLAAAVFALGLVVGCGGGGEDDAATVEKADAAATVEKADAAATEVAVHDCDGGCGMKDVPVDEMTVVDGKYYCAECAKKIQEGDHSGHDHD